MLTQMVSEISVSTVMELGVIGQYLVVRCNMCVNGMVRKLAGLSEMDRYDHQLNVAIWDKISADSGNFSIRFGDNTCHYC